jgi:hypothetical protein
VVTFDLLAGTGNVAVTGTGFTPDVVLFLIGSISQSAVPYSTNNARLQLGAMDKAGNQWAAGIVAQNGVSPSQAVRGMVTDSCLGGVTPGGGTFNPKASFVSMDSNGFTINQTVGSGFGNIVAALALKGGQWKVGSTVKPTGGAPATHAVTGVGFVPKGLFFAGIQSVVNASESTHAELGVGFCSGVGAERAIARIEKNAANPTVVKTYTDSKSFVKVDNFTPAVDAAAILASFDTDGYTLTWNPNDAVATQLGYIAASDNAAAPTGGQPVFPGYEVNRPFVQGGI